MSGVRRTVLHFTVCIRGVSKKKKKKKKKKKGETRRNNRRYRVNSIESRICNVDVEMKIKIFFFFFFGGA